MCLAGLRIRSKIILRRRRLVATLHSRHNTSTWKGILHATRLSMAIKEHPPSKYLMKPAFLRIYCDIHPSRFGNDLHVVEIINLLSVLGHAHTLAKQGAVNGAGGIYFTVQNFHCLQLTTKTNHLEIANHTVIMASAIIRSLSGSLGRNLFPPHWQ